MVYTELSNSSTIPRAELAAYDVRVALAPKEQDAAIPIVEADGSLAMIVTTGNEITGQSIASDLGVVRGIVVRAPSITQGLLEGFK